MQATCKVALLTCGTMEQFQLRRQIQPEFFKAASSRRYYSIFTIMIYRFPTTRYHYADDTAALYQSASPKLIHCHLQSHINRCDKATYLDLILDRRLNSISICHTLSKRLNAHWLDFTRCSAQNQNLTLTTMPLCARSLPTQLLSGPTP